MVGGQSHEDAADSSEQGNMGAGLPGRRNLGDALSPAFGFALLIGSSALVWLLALILAIGWVRG